jgi:uncharacterized protein YndB with AHSA1/START domain
MEVNMATAIITPDQDAIVSEIEIAAPPERVFQALVDPAQMMQWWTSDQCKTEYFEMDGRRGGKWRFSTSKSATLTVNGVNQFFCHGEVLEYDPPRVLAYTWIGNWHDDKSRATVVRWELSPVGKGTKVKVTHSGLAQENVARKDYSSGWPGVLGALKQFVEK